MNREDVVHLANLARITLSEADLETLPVELDAIVSYVSTVSDIAADATETIPSPGVRFNVFRSDEVTNSADQHTEALLNEMPEREGRYLKVKKILGATE